MDTPQLSIGQRLMADSPPFWKKVGYVGFVIGLVVATIGTNIPAVPKTWLTLGAGISGTLIVASALAVDVTKLISGGFSPAALNATLPDLINKVDQIHQGVQDTIGAVKAIPATPVVSVTNIAKEAEQAAPALLDALEKAADGTYLEPIDQAKT